MLMGTLAPWGGGLSKSGVAGLQKSFTFEKTGICQLNYNNDDPEFIYKTQIHFAVWYQPRPAVVFTQVARA